MPTKNRIFLFAVVAAIALVGHGASAEVPDSDKANGLFSIDTSSVSRTASADHDDKIRLLRTGDATAAEERVSRPLYSSKVGQSKLNEYLKLGSLPQKFKMKTMSKDRKATSETEVERITKSLRNVGLYNNVHTFKMKPSEAKWSYNDKTPEQVSQQLGLHDGNTWTLANFEKYQKFMKNFNKRNNFILSSLIGWNEMNIPPKNILKKLEDKLKQKEV